MPHRDVYTYIHFVTSKDPNFFFSIRTAWTETYDDVLRNAIHTSGYFDITNELYKKDRVFLCNGWISYRTIQVAGIEHGEIEYKAKNASAGGLRPSNETLVRIEEILLAHAPDHDVLVLALWIVVPSLASSMLVVIFMTFMNRSNQQDSSAKTANTNEADDIELQSMKSEASAAPPYSREDPIMPEQARIREPRIDTLDGATEVEDEERPTTQYGMSSASRAPSIYGTCSSQFAAEYRRMIGSIEWN
ncbi:hypothetical protein EJ04DRAFT_524426 [Polyplosphaeria fusca]|uniref:Uncharacterized protein n=1 Tax=Polyplosphaeria fusca TaxID=682080 RepID=A0A9P4QTH2_9PLEO|nr:hypothetical protein EJ04DRAFT_524426 [Polyplosphaeria fusca]